MVKVIFGAKSRECLKSFPVPSPGFRHKLSRLPLRQGFVLKSKTLLQAITFDEESANDAQKVTAPPKREICKIRFFCETSGKTISGRFVFFFFLEELGIFERHWQIPRQKLLPVVPLFSLYDPWRGGKRPSLCFGP